MVRSYIEGACWVMSYYYEGCASWSWYYPYQYAPFTSDFKNFSDLDVKFKEGTPFKPFDQLMAVLPAASAHCLPEVYQPLFTDEKSPIIDFYPENFEVDMNGHRFAWQGIALLPFIDEARLLNAIRPLEVQLSEAEKIRNQRSNGLVFVHQRNELSESFTRVEKANEALSTRNIKIIIDPSKSKGTIGLLGPCLGESKPSRMTAPYGLTPDILENKVYGASYHLPKPYERHQSKIMPGTLVNTKLKYELDLSLNPAESVLWHQKGRGPQGFQGDNQNKFRHQQQVGIQYQPNVASHRSTYQYDQQGYRDNYSYSKNPINIQVRSNQPHQINQHQGQNGGLPPYQQQSSPQVYAQAPPVYNQNTYQRPQFNMPSNQGQYQQTSPYVQQNQYAQQPPASNYYYQPNQQVQYQQPYQQQNQLQQPYYQGRQASFQANQQYQQTQDGQYSQNQYGYSYYPDQQQLKNQQQHPRQQHNRFLPLQKGYQQ